jgi:hypothetical protein
MTDRQAGLAIVGTVAVCYAMALGGGWTILDQPPGGPPWAFHLFNIICHATASLLVWRLAQRLLPSPGGLIAALWFAVQPVHVEAVASIAGRGEIMTTVFVLAGLLAYTHDRRWAVLSFALALLSGGAGFVTHVRDVLSVDRWLAMCAAVPQYVRLMLFPARLLIDYGPNVVPRQYGIGVLCLAVWGALVVAAWKRAPVVAFGLLWCAIAIVPSRVVLSERMLYLPSVGVALIVGWIAIRLLPTRGAAVALAAAALLLAARTWTRVPFWHSSQTVLVGALHDEPQSYRVHMLAATVLVQGQHWPEATAQYARAMAIAPTEAAPWLRFAEVRGAAGDWRGAMVAARHAYALAPDSLRAVQMVQIAGLQFGDTAAVDTTFEQALHDHPKDPRLRFVYAMMLRNRGDTAAATRIGLPGIGSLLQAAQ